MEAWSDTVPEKTHRIDIFAEEAVRFIEMYREEPMFIHFSPYLVHGPITAVPEYVDHYTGSWSDTAYASMVEKLDEAIGKVLAALEINGLTETTLVVFCSDNGGIAAVNAQMPWRAGKGSYYEGGIREPMILSWPGTIKAGRSEEVVNALDFYPTFMEVAGLDCSPDLDGVSLMPLLTGTGDWKAVPQFWHFPVYLQAYNGAKDQARDPLFRTRPGSAVRVGQWKLHEYFEEGALELYDLSKDRGERHNLAAAQPEKTAELKRVLDNWRQRIGAPVPSDLNPKYSEEAEAEALVKFE
jgi:arylsulfatase A-like enzyme